MKKVAFISNNIPLPEDLNGNTVNIINIIRELKSRGFIIDYYLFSENSDRDGLYEEIFKKEVDSLIIGERISKYLFLLNYFRIKVKLDYPVFFCNFNTGFYYSRFISPLKVLYAADSISYQYSKQKGFVARFWQIKLLIEEKLLYKHFNKVIFVSPLDLAYSKLPESQGVHIPIGYQNQEYNISRSNTKRFDLVFSGNYDYLPNLDAYEYFIKDIFPLLIQKRPDIKICFVGRNPGKTMLGIEESLKKNIIVTGEVPSVFSYLYDSRIYISPLRKGSGMKNKILQAMIAKLPIVCSTESMTGITVFNQTSIYIANNAESFAEKILELLTMSEPELQMIGLRNYDCFSSNYTWDAIVGRYYEPLLSSRIY